MRGVTKTKRPRMTNHRGRTWDCGTVVLHDGTTLHAHLDTSWGTRFYFVIDGQWYVAPIARYEQPGMARELIFDLRKERKDWR